MCPVTDSFSVSEKILGQRRGASKDLCHSDMLRVHDTCRDNQSCLGCFLVYVLKEDASVGVGVDGLFC